MRAIIKLLRIKHWVKNLFLFIPLFFAGDFFETTRFEILLAGFFSFSLLASGVYVINDYMDRKVDRLHPKKKLRPIASGAIKETSAWFIIAILLLAGIGSAYGLGTVLDNQNFLYFLLFYLVMNLGYSFGLKHIPIVDLFIVSFGFLIRIYAGGALAQVGISHWLSIMILLLALFLIIAKRRDDIVIQTETGEVIRKSSQAYNLEFINSCLTLLSAVVIVSYIMYTVSPEVTQRFNSEYLFVTTIFVIAGIMRYLQITFVEQNSGSPTSILFKDKFIALTILGWIISFFAIIYIYKK
jgi:decaprenyl-phosphate phosphoribosyltransferase